MKKIQLYWVNLDPSVGVEMNKLRPCLIVSPDAMNDHLKTVIIVPLTSPQRQLLTRILIKATPTGGLKNDSYAAPDQIKTVDKSGLSNYIGEISETEKHKVSEILMEMFDY